ncbi:hypothetical protein P3T43_001775 [Paraburkholderia sp. GAS41]|uniref:hypothetical protein n=1 Tax=Paraburkholderia sp. GAS41 TaxID=3035134 RepID=UPI003D25C803
MSLREKLVERLSTKPASEPAATFFSDPKGTQTRKSPKGAKGRKSSAKPRPEEAIDTAPAVESGVQLQTEIERPSVAVHRMLERASQIQGYGDAQPTNATKSDTFRRPGLYNSLGLRGNGPMHFSTHGGSRHDEALNQARAAEREAKRVEQESRALRGLDWLSKILGG